MTAAVLRNICIYQNDPCNPRWRLKVENFELRNLETQRCEGQNSKSEGIEVVTKNSSLALETLKETMINTGPYSLVYFF